MNSSMTFEDARVHYTVLKQQPDTTRGNHTQPSDHYSHAGNLKATHHTWPVTSKPKSAPASHNPYQHPPKGKAPELTFHP